MDTKNRYITPIMILSFFAIFGIIVLIERYMEIPLEEYKHLEARLQDKTFMASSQGLNYFHTLNKAYFPGNKITRSEKRQIDKIYEDWNEATISDSMYYSLKDEAERRSHTSRETPQTIYVQVLKPVSRPADPKPEINDQEVDSFDLERIQTRLDLKDFMASEQGKQYRQVLSQALADNKIMRSEAVKLAQIFLDYAKPQTSTEDIKNTLEKLEQTPATK